MNGEQKPLKIFSTFNIRASNLVLYNLPSIGPSNCCSYLLPSAFVTNMEWIAMSLFNHKQNSLHISWSSATLSPQISKSLSLHSEKVYSIYIDSSQDLMFCPKSNLVTIQMVTCFIRGTWERCCKFCFVPMPLNYGEILWSTGVSWLIKHFLKS